VDEGPSLAHLLKEVLNRGIAPDYVHKLLGAFPDAESEQADLLKRQATGLELVEDLSDRLVISLNTVRHHTKNIYSKLEVNNRTQAIKKANDLNLLL
jgi:LuxR family maltose regulon positive regulatory protein